MSKLLTIVVPVYKVEPYINKCLDSCLIYKSNEQGEKVLDDDLMNQLEVIIVNDGTPDRSAEMSREYSKRYPQTFRQIDKENGGHGSAWNVGLKEATGKYLRFLDSDDWLTNLDRLMLDLQHCEADVVLNPFEVCSLTDENIVIPTPDISGAQKPCDGSHSYPITKEIWMDFSHKYSNVNFWSVTYKTEILKPLWPLFAEKVMYDDYILTWAPLIYGRSCVAFDYVLYNYLVGRPEQTVRVRNREKRARSYSKCFKQYEKIRSEVNEDLPKVILEIIDYSISRYANYILGYLVFLPYKQVKTELAHLMSKNYFVNIDSKIIVRYHKLPFFIFYFMEHFRNTKNNILGKHL